jgi:Ca2+-binding EF-hand superfamily protein
MSKWILGVLLAAAPCVAMAAEQAVVHSQKEEDAKFEQLFRALDVDKSGKLSRAEVAQKVPVLAENFDQIDVNHDGGLTRREIKDAFIAAAKRQREFSENLAKADTDHNGKLSREEAKVLPNISAHFDEIDSNHDGELVIKEIADYVRANANKASEPKLSDAASAAPVAHTP